MLTPTLLLTQLALGDPAAPPPSFDPVRAELVDDGDTLEIVTFDEHDEPIGTALLTLVDGRLEFATSYADGYATIVLAPEHWQPQHGMVDMQRRCLPDSSAPSGQDTHTWAQTDLADPCAALERIALVVQVAEPELRALEVRLNEDQAHKPTKKDCIVKFALAGSLCAATAIWPNPIAAVSCVIGIFEGWCWCEEYLPVKVC